MSFASECRFRNDVSRSSKRSGSGFCMLYDVCLPCMLYDLYLPMARWLRSALADAVETVPCVLAANARVHAQSVMGELRRRHGSGLAGEFWGIDGTSGNIADMRTLQIVEPARAKQRTVAAAVAAVISLLRIDMVIVHRPLSHSLEAAKRVQANSAQDARKTKKPDCHTV